MMDVTKAEATKKAVDYAEKHGYSGVELRSENFLCFGIVPSFAFYLMSDRGLPGDTSELTGLPEIVAIDKIGGQVLETRALL